MGRLLGWTLGVGCALAITAAPAAAETHVSIGVFAPNVGARVEIGRPVYAPPVYAPVYPVPVYRAPVYRERVYRRPVYREQVVIIESRHDNGRHNGWHKHDRDHWRDERHDSDRRW